MRPAIAYIHLDHLLHNYQILRNRAAKAQIMAVVKTDAYGHGLQHIAPALAQAGCHDFAVTDADEGVRLRSLLDQDAQITLLSGLFDPEDAILSEKYQLTPVITETQHVQWLKKAGFQGKVWLKVDTGMQRLGANNPEELIHICHDQHIDLIGIMSHLACADTPEHPLNRIQADAFTQLHQSLAPQLLASLLNSAGIVGSPDQAHDIVRPGLALYGAEPIPDEPLGLKPVMQLSAKVMQIRHITRGSTLSYGASFIAKKDMMIALICIGYGDGLPRILSNRGYAEYQGKCLPIVGRICMDYCLLDCSDTTLNEGDSVTFWGSENLSPNHVADLAETIPYTLMTGIHARVHRITLPSEI